MSEAETTTTDRKRARIAQLLNRTDVEVVARGLYIEIRPTDKRLRPVLADNRLSAAAIVAKAQAELTA